MSDNVEILTGEGVRRIRMVRPDKKNAITGAMYTAMAEALETGETDDAVRAFVFLGVPGAFSAGNDIVDFVAMSAGGALGAPIIRFLKALARATKPMVAGVDGLAIGIGTTLLLHCDLVYASPGSILRTPFVDLGLVPENASSLLAPRVMGHQRAFELLCLGAPFSAGKAQAAGIVNEVVAAGEVEAKALAMAAALAGKPAEALAIARRLVNGAPDEVLARIDEEADAFRDRLASPEARAAFAAFLGKSGR
ncbi:MAG: crotonase/enoyl-CoA hydratase family protein [Hyphomicrobiales bacterium]